MATCEAITFDLAAHGFAASPVSSTTAADVSSQEVSMPRILMSRRRSPFELEGLAQRLDVRRPEDAPLGDDAGNQLVRRDVECRIPDVRARGRQLGAADVGDLARAALLDRNMTPVGRGEIDGGQRCG